LVVDYCQFGRAFRKRTKVLFWNLRDSHDRAILCKPQKVDGVSLCSSTDRPHEELSGAAQRGGFKTRQGEEYPEQFAELLAKLLLE